MTIQNLTANVKSLDMIEKINEIIDNGTSGNINSSYFIVTGEIAGSDNGDFKGVGQASVRLYSFGLAQVHYSYNITTNKNPSPSYFNYGLSTAKLTALNNNIPAINPQNGGNLIFVGTDGKLLINITGYGGSHTESHGTNSNYWIPSRACYESSNTRYLIGAWPTNAMAVNYLVQGTCWGTFTV